MPKKVFIGLTFPFFIAKFILALGQPTKVYIALDVPKNRFVKKESKFVSHISEWSVLCSAKANVKGLLVRTMFFLNINTIEKIILQV